MRKWLIGICVLSLVAVALPAVADDDDFAFETEGQVRARWDQFENYTDGNDDNDDSFNWFPFRANVGLTGSFNDMFWGFIELQASGYFGDGFGGAQAYPGPQSGNVDVYQAYAMWDNANWDLRFGRAEHQIGNELVMGNNSFYNGLTFDGLNLTGEWKSLGLDVFLYQTREGQFPGSESDDDALFMGANFDVKIGDHHIEPYLVHLQDDNDGAAFMSDPRISVSTIGVLWKRATVDNRGWDISLEAAGQFGDVGRDDGTPGAQLDAAGTIFEGWFGWSFGRGGRVHVGTLWASGDDNGADEDLDAWIPLFEDGHAYNRLGNLDLFNGGSPAAPANGLDGLALTGMSNVQDINLGYTWGPAAESKHTFFAALHSLTLAEAVGDDDIGTEFDVTYNYEFVKNSQFQIGVGYLAAGDALGTDADNITRVWFQLESSWGKAKSWTKTGQQSWMN